MTMDNLSKVILDNVRAEAEDIIKQAEEKAQQKIESARIQQNSRYEEEKTRLLAEAHNEAARIKAQSSISTRIELLKAKNEIIDDIVAKVKKSLAKYPDKASLAVNCIREGIQAGGAETVIVQVAPEDIEKVRDIIKKDKELSSRISEIKELKCSGGSIVEDSESGISIDNTFDTRLESLLPKVLPEISQELFGL